jgi:hypothetical protein
MALYIYALKSLLAVELASEDSVNWERIAGSLLPVD